MAAKDPRQANPRITLMPMTVVCRPAMSVVAPCFDEEGVLPLSMMLGWVMAAVGFFFAIYSSGGAILRRTVPGWSSLMAALGLLSGMQFLILGVIGAYLGWL